MPRVGRGHDGPGACGVHHAGWVEVLPYVVVCAALAVGAIAQRTVGMGYGLVVTPTVVLAVGPIEGVLVLNVFGTVVCGCIIWRVWRDIDWRMLVWILVPALVMTVPGIVLSLATNADVLKVAVGIIAIIGVAISVGFTRTRHTLGDPVTRVALGGVAGVLNSSVGLGAPAVGVLAIVSRWEHRAFAATMQPFWMLLSAATTLARIAIEPQGAPDWPWWAWLMACAPVLGGVLLGDALAARIDHVLARRLVIAFSVLGGLAVLVAGVVGLVG